MKRLLLFSVEKKWGSFIWNTLYRAYIVVFTFNVAFVHLAPWGLANIPRHSEGIWSFIEDPAVLVKSLFELYFLFANLSLLILLVLSLIVYAIRKIYVTYYPVEEAVTAQGLKRIRIIESLDGTLIKVEDGRAVWTGRGSRQIAIMDLPVDFIDKADNNNSLTIPLKLPYGRYNVVVPIIVNIKMHDELSSSIISSYIIINDPNPDTTLSNFTFNLNAYIKSLVCIDGAKDESTKRTLGALLNCRLDSERLEILRDLMKIISIPEKSEIGLITISLDREESIDRLLRSPLVLEPVDEQEKEED